MQNVALKLNEYYNEKKHGKSTVPKQEVDQQYVFEIEDLILWVLMFYWIH